ncbi:hypothetical protein EBN15_09985 [Xanthomonas cucurbitae]|nr:hypothetical protein EBN15_09985 [Xanthomonas cucurbitae]
MLKHSSQCFRIRAQERIAAGNVVVQRKATEMYSCSLIQWSWKIKKIGSSRIRVGALRPLNLR